MLPDAAIKGDTIINYYDSLLILPDCPGHKDATQRPSNQPLLEFNINPAELVGNDPLM